MRCTRNAIILGIAPDNSRHAAKDLLHTSGRAPDVP